MYVEPALQRTPYTPPVLPLDTHTLRHTGRTSQMAQHFTFVSKVVIISVADPDPVGSGLFWSPGSGKIPDPDPLSTKIPL